MAEEQKARLLKDFDYGFIDLFKTEVHDRAKEIDPNNGEDWFSMTLGWAIAKGMSADDAGSFAVYIRYYTDLG